MHLKNLYQKKKKTLPYTIQNIVNDLNVNIKTIRVSYSNTEHNGKGKFIDKRAQKYRKDQKNSTLLRLQILFIEVTKYKRQLKVEDIPIHINIKVLTLKIS